MDAFEITGIVGVVVLVALIAALVWLIGRRRWLTRMGGSFECGLRQSERGAFMLGVARYNGQYVEWFRAFSLSLAPRVRIQQAQWEIGTTRAPTAAEAPDLYGLDSVMELRHRGGDPSVYMAMSPASSMGLRSWLESAPPGRGRYGHTAH